VSRRGLEKRSFVRVLPNERLSHNCETESNAESDDALGGYRKRVAEWGRCRWWGVALAEDGD